jgi:putative membrane protein
MNILFSILANGIILFAVVSLLPGVTAAGGWELYLIGGIVLGLLNAFVRPVLDFFGFPFVILTFGIFILVINGIILALLQKIITAINVSGVALDFNGFGNFAIAVVIFTIFNTIYGVLFK